MSCSSVEERREDEIPISPAPDSTGPENPLGRKIFFLDSWSGSKRSELPHVEMGYCPRDEVSRRLFHSNSESCDCDCASDGCWACIRRNRKCFCRFFLLALGVAVIILLFGFLSYNLTREDDEELSIETLKTHWVIHEHFYNSSDKDNQGDSSIEKIPVVESPVPIFETVDDYDSNTDSHKHHYQVVEVGYGHEGEDIEPLSYSTLNAPKVDSKYPALIINDRREPYRSKRSLDHKSGYEVVVQEANDIEEEVKDYLKNFDQKARTVFQPFSLTTPMYSTPMDSDDEYSLEINDIEEELKSKFLNYVTDDVANGLEDEGGMVEGKSAEGEHKHKDINLFSELLGFTDLQERSAGNGDNGKYNVPGNEDVLYTTEHQQTVGVLYTTEGYSEVKLQSTTSIPEESVLDLNNTEGRAESNGKALEGEDTSRTFSSFPLIQMGLPFASIFGFGQQENTPVVSERPDKVKGISLAEAKEKKKDKRKYLLLNSRVVGGSSDIKFPTGPDVSKPFVNAFESLKTNQQLSFTPSAASQYIVPYQMCFFASPKPPPHVAQPRTFPLTPLFPNLGDKNLGDKQPYPPSPQNFLSFSINNFANPPFRPGNQPPGGPFYNFPSQQHFPFYGTGPGSKQPIFCTYLQPPLFQFPTVPGTADFSHAKCVDCEDIAKSTSGERYLSSAWERLCSNDQISCRDGSTCIPIENWCDNQVHCKDASDETFCSCRERVARDRLCDGYVDCPQSEDEIGCFDCPKSAFSCDSAVSPQSCIPLSKRCDGMNDCSTGADEADCSALFFHMRQNDSYHVSQTSGFLHRNWKGDWFPVCVEVGDDSWAIEACSGELGHSPPEVEVSFLPVPDHYKGPFIVRQEDGTVTRQEHCKGHVSTFVKCPTMKCGTRVKFPSLQGFESRFKRTNIYSRFNRTKRFVQNKPFNNISQPQWKAQPRIDEKQNRGQIKREETGRVVGGRESEPRAWPWVVAIYKDGGFHCGGVILDEKWVLTAAHCLEQYWKHYYEVRGGMLRRFSFSAMEQIRSVTQIIVHENYNPSIMSNDIAVLRLDKPFHFNRWVRPACLPSLDEGLSKFLWAPVPGTTCVAVGWGAIRERGSDPDQLREVEIPIMSRCKHKEDLAGAEICAGKAEGGKDTCQGDSGGPLLCRDSNTPSSWYVAGIVSHGEGCARPGEPGAYTRLSLFIDWITANTNDFLTPLSKPLKSCPGFRCRSGNKLCIPAKWVCNGFTDCLEAEDERNCNSSFMLSEIYNRQSSGIESKNNKDGEKSANEDVEESRKSTTELNKEYESLKMSTVNVKEERIEESTKHTAEYTDDVSLETPTTVSYEEEETNKVYTTEKLREQEHKTDVYTEETKITPSVIKVWEIEQSQQLKAKEAQTTEQLEVVTEETNQKQTTKGQKIEVVLLPATEEPKTETKGLEEGSVERRIQVTEEPKMVLMTTTEEPGIMTVLLPTTSLPIAKIDKLMETTEQTPSEEIKTVLMSTSEKPEIRTVKLTTTEGLEIETSERQMETTEDALSGRLKTVVMETTEEPNIQTKQVSTDGMGIERQMQTTEKQTTKEQQTEVVLLPATEETEFIEVKTETTEEPKTGKEGLEEGIIERRIQATEGTKMVLMETTEKPRIMTPLPPTTEGLQIETIQRLMETTDQPPSGEIKTMPTERTEKPESQVTTIKSLQIETMERQMEMTEEPLSGVLKTVVLETTEEPKQLSTTEGVGMEVIERQMQTTEKLKSEELVHTTYTNQMKVKEAPQVQTTEGHEMGIQKSEPMKTTEKLDTGIRLLLTTEKPKKLDTTEEPLLETQTEEATERLKWEKTETVSLLITEHPEVDAQRKETTEEIKLEKQEVVETEVVAMETEAVEDFQTTTETLQLEEVADLRTGYKKLEGIETEKESSSEEDGTKETTGEVDLENATTSLESFEDSTTKKAVEKGDSSDSEEAPDSIESTTTKYAKEHRVTTTQSLEDSSSEEVVDPSYRKLDRTTEGFRKSTGFIKAETILETTTQDEGTTSEKDSTTAESREATRTFLDVRITGHRRSKSDTEFFQCENIVQSILNSYRCDGKLDCEDGTDETNCTCADILRHSNPKLLCNGRYDCQDLSDETNCSYCSEDEFHCRLSRECIPSTERCNGKAKCKYGEDERKCFALAKDGKFKYTLNTQGVLMTNKNGVWSTECQETPLGTGTAIDICTDLGTIGYERYENVTLGPYCTGFHVTCSESLIRSLNYYRAESGGYIWPWNAVVYSDGAPICNAALLQPNWLLGSTACVRNISLSSNHVIAKLGVTTPPSKITETNIKLIRIDAVRNIQNSSISLLHLSRTVKPTEYIRPIGIPYLFNSNPKKDVCVAVGDDQTVFLKPTPDCPTCYRKVSPTAFNCESDPWVGVIACQSRVGWYPSSVYSEPLGHCGFLNTEYDSIEKKLSYIYTSMDEDVEVHPELPCSGFRCPEGRCIPLEKMCDGFVDCSSGKDEDFKACSRKKRECGVGELKCRNGACVSKIAFADGVDDCGDGSDEPANVTCVEYLRLTAPQRICDGRRNCYDKTDEDKCSCERGRFECKSSNRCLPRDFVCDGEKDCPNGEDEKHCIGRKFIQKHHKNHLEIMQKSYGVWHSICLSDVPKDRADAVCRDLGFSESLYTYEKNRTVIMPNVDSFSWVKLNPKTSIALRSDKPFVKLIKVKKTCTAVKCI